MKYKTRKDVIIVITYIIFGILTYKVPRYEIFYDKKEEKYGINQYVGD